MQSLGRLARLLAAHAPYDGAFALRVPSPRGPTLEALPRDGAGDGPARLCIVAQGAKIVMLGREVYSYDASRMIAYAVDLPSPRRSSGPATREPFLALKLDLTVQIAELTLKVTRTACRTRRTTGACTSSRRRQPSSTQRRAWSN